MRVKKVVLKSRIDLPGIANKEIRRNVIPKPGEEISMQSEGVKLKLYEGVFFIPWDEVKFVELDESSAVVLKKTTRKKTGRAYA